MTALLALGLAALAPAVEDGPSHGENAVFAAVVAEGMDVVGQAARLPGPTFPDGQSAEQQRAALREVAGSDRAAGELLRDSVTAPFRLSLRDVEAGGATVRAGVLYFALHVDLDAIEPDELFAPGTGEGEGEGEAVEAANMRVEARVLGPDDLDPAVRPPDGEEFVRSIGRLLDRIAVESTARVAWSRTADSVVIASMTDRRFDDAGRWPNQWRAIEGRGASESLGPPHPFAGGVGYAKLTRLADEPGTVLVELHFAFAEPLDWFDGAPILRSKFGLIAQDQIRRLRRELDRSASGR